MSVWDSYQSRLEAVGTTKCDTALRRGARNLNMKSPDSLSYHTVDIDGISQEVMIINTDNLDEKFIYALPGEDIPHGGIITWADNHWIVTDKDASKELYARAKMIQCNYLLRWIDRDAIIHEQWCVVEDGTKYLTGIYEDRDFFITRGDSRLGLIITKNIHTSKLSRGQRFLIDDPESETMLAYELTKPFKLGGVFNGEGIFKFVLQEVNTTDDDNQELRVADYYQHFPKVATVDPSPEDRIDPDGTKTESGKKVWL